MRSQQDRLTLLTASMTGEWRLLTAVTDGTTAIGRFQSPQLVFGTVFHIMSRPHRLWLSSEVAWRLVSSVALFRHFINPVTARHFGHFNRSFYLLIHLLYNVYCTAPLFMGGGTANLDDMIWYDMIWYDMIWYDMIWYMSICPRSHFAHPPKID